MLGVQGEALLQARDVALVHDLSRPAGPARDLEEAVRSRDEPEVTCRSRKENPEEVQNAVDP